MATNVLGTVYETLLCSPGMNESVKVDLKINRKTILLLDTVITDGLKLSGDNQLLKMVPKEDLEELNSISMECLKKAGLAELSDKIKLLTK